MFKPPHDKEPGAVVGVTPDGFVAHFDPSSENDYYHCQVTVEDFIKDTDGEGWRLLCHEATLLGITDYSAYLKQWDDAHS